MTRITGAILLLVALLFPIAGFGQVPIRLRVDATEAPRKIYHAELTIPAAPGPLNLFYPKWIPGNHSPSGPINNIVWLKFSTGGRVISWTRDPVTCLPFTSSSRWSAEAPYRD